MTTETKGRKNTDYSASAMNLENPKEVLADLHAYHSVLKQLEELKVKMDACIPRELSDQLTSLQTQLGGCTEAIKSDIEIFGSYQDLEKGWYGIKQRAVSKSFSAQAFKITYPQFTPVVIVETVNEKALAGLIKGGLLTEIDLKEKGITQETESFRFIIK